MTDPSGICRTMPLWMRQKPGKVRVVFDCAASQSGVSLNNQCMQGPDLVNKLLSVLLRFRQYHYAIMADIESTYLQVRIPPRDRNALRFLWFVNDALTHYRMTSHLFGGVWCASSSTYALRRTAIDAGASDVVRNTIMRLFYVDDLLTSVSDKETASEIINGTQDALKAGGFRLTKFVVNDPELLGQIAPEDRAAEVKEPEMLNKALGVQWDVTNDTFLTLGLFGRRVIVVTCVCPSVCLSVPIILVNTITLSVYPINPPNLLGGLNMALSWMVL